MGINTFPAASSGKTLKFQRFTSTGTWTCPSTTDLIEILLVAGGGGGGSNANGGSCGHGGGGQVVKQFLTVVPGTTYTITIGGGGGANGANNAGSDGTDSSFGSLLVCGGGGGGAGRGTAGRSGRAGTNAYGQGHNGGSVSLNYGGQALGGSGGSADGGFLVGAGGAGGPGLSLPQPGNTALSYQPGMGGAGLYGFGGGAYPLYMPWSANTSQSYGGYAGRTNTGWGGEGGYRAGHGDAITGSSGGSGYCEFSYWE